MTDLKTQILEMSRQDQLGALSPWFDNALNQNIKNDVFLDEETIGDLGESIVAKLRDYRIQANIKTAVVGMSGGVDSALTAALLRQAGWYVIGVVMPIHQNPEETVRGIEACNDLEIDCKQIDLSDLYDVTLTQMVQLDENIKPERGITKRDAIRRGNIKARLRMITLYNLASANNGLVASTDNYSELAVGFWTLHGDVGDLSPIQSLTKSWEVPMMAKIWGVPESIWRAKPTDGLGVDDGDEAQFGFSYLELDLMLLALGNVVNNGLFYDTTAAGRDRQRHVRAGVNHISRREVLDGLNIITEGTVVDEHAEMVLNGLLDRMGSTWFKRMNPVNIKHPVDPGRYARLSGIDCDMFHPVVVKE